MRVQQLAILLSWFATNKDMKLPGFFAEASLYLSTEEYRMTGISSEDSEAVYRQQSCNGPDPGLCNGTFTDLISDQSCGRFGDAYDSEQMAVVQAFILPVPRPCLGNKIRINGICRCPPGTEQHPLDLTCHCLSHGSVLINGKCICLGGRKRCPPNKVDAPCVNTNADLGNCGDCGIVCPEAPGNGWSLCNGGKCSSGCFQGYVLVNGTCIELRCGPGQILIRGQCIGHPPPCLAYETECNGVCGCFNQCDPLIICDCSPPNNYPVNNCRPA